MTDTDKPILHFCEASIELLDYHCFLYNENQWNVYELICVAFKIFWLSLKMRIMMSKQLLLKVNMEKLVNWLEK